MAAVATGSVNNRFLGHDRPQDLLAILALIAVYVGLDRGSQALVDLEQTDLGQPSLVVTSLTSRIPYLVGFGAVALVASIIGTREFFCRWSALEFGRVLRLLVGPLILLAAWEGAFHPYNFVADASHWIDRILVVVLAMAAFYKPVFLFPFAVVVRIIGHQTLFPFGTAAAFNIDELPTIAILIVAACHALHVVDQRRARHLTAPTVLLLIAAVAAHFYIPGKGKVGLGWFGENDISNLPLGAYTAGWLGDGDGGWANFLATSMRRFSVVVKGLTLAVELGAVVAVVHRRLTGFWLLGAVIFHLVTLAVTGFFFLGWVILEVGLLAVLSSRQTHAWMQENVTPARGLVAVLTVLGAPVLFHPPGLAWFDAPVSYGYQVDAVGESGTNYLVPLHTFAPLDHELTFARLQLAPTPAASGGYGAVGSSERFQLLSEVANFSQLSAIEQQDPAPDRRDASVAFMVDFFDRTQQDLPYSFVYRLGPPSSFWTNRDGPNYRFEEPLVSLDVYRITRIGDGDQPVLSADEEPGPELDIAFDASTRFERVLHIDRDEDGRAGVAE